MHLGRREARLDGAGLERAAVGPTARWQQRTRGAQSRGGERSGSAPASGAGSGAGLGLDRYLRPPDHRRARLAGAGMSRSMRGRSGRRGRGSVVLSGRAAPAGAAWHRRPLGGPPLAQRSRSSCRPASSSDSLVVVAVHLLEAAGLLAAGGEHQLEVVRAGGVVERDLLGDLARPSRSASSDWSKVRMP